MFCIHCGRPCAASDAFCSNCGKPVPSELQQTEADVRTASSTTARRGVGIWLLLGAVCLVALLAVIANWSNTTSPAPAAQSTAPTTAFDPARVRQSVLTLLCYNKAGNLIGQGSGFLMRADGIAITNWHVAKSAYSMSGTGGDGRVYKVSRFINVDSDADLVLLQLTNEDDTPVTGVVPVRVADSRTVAAGQKVFTISAPQGLDQTVSDGLLSAIRSFEGQQYLQISAPVSHGSSGGPVFNSQGEVVGIIKGLLPSGQNLNFAIPIDAAVRLLNAPARGAMAAARSANSNADAPESSDPSAIFNRGYAAFNKQEYAVAARYFEQVLAAKPTETAALFNAALSYLNMGNFGQATDYFQRFLELARPDDDGAPTARKWIAAYAASLVDKSEPAAPAVGSATAPTTPSPSSPTAATSVSSSAAPTPRAPSIDGLTASQVRQILGNPSLTQIDADGVTTWYYDTNDGTVRVYFWRDRASLRRPR